MISYTQEVIFDPLAIAGWVATVVSDEGVVSSVATPQVPGPCTVTDSNCVKEAHHRVHPGVRAVTLPELAHDQRVLAQDASYGVAKLSNIVEVIVLVHVKRRVYFVKRISRYKLKPAVDVVGEVGTSDHDGVARSSNTDHVHQMLHPCAGVSDPIARSSSIPPAVPHLPVGSRSVCDPVGKRFVEEVEIYLVVVFERCSHILPKLRRLRGVRHGFETIGRLDFAERLWVG